MARNKKTIDKKTSEAGIGQASFFVEPGKRVKITLDIAKTIVDGKVSFTVHIEQLSRESNEFVEIDRSQPVSESMVPNMEPRWQWAGFDGLKTRLQTYDLATWLFISAVAIYLLTRLIGLTQFPIYFFTDEAIQSLSMVDLIQNGYRDSEGMLFPAYFRNGDYYNIGLSVYLQWLPAILLGKSAFATRATSALVTLIAAMSVGFVLRDIFKLKYWWSGTLFLSITPAWFLHSRTAFETAEFVAFYAGTLCAYLYYRHKSPRYLYSAIFLGALAFYTYSPAQVIMPLTALGLLVSDWRYHWENRRTLLKGLVLILVLALPYIRSTIDIPTVPFAQLRILYSYWFEEIPLSAKIARYFSEYGIGLSPWYWYVPNDRDLVRHLMKGYGHIMIATLPFILLGINQALRNLHLSAYRAILIALLISPAASALVQVNITRMLVFVVPAALLTAIGLDRVLQWIEDPKKRLIEVGKRRRPALIQTVAVWLILVIGILIASSFKESINGIVLWVLAILTALNISGSFTMVAHFLTRSDILTKYRLWTLPRSVVAFSVFIVLAVTNIRMLNDALQNAPLWFRDYGLGGMQYGGFQVFKTIEQYLKDNPNPKIIFSPTWANGGDVLARFFLDDSPSVQIGSVQAHIMQQLPLDDNTLFVMTPQEYDIAKASLRLANLEIETIVPYPDGSPGFYFVRLQYADNVDEIFAVEKAARQTLREATLTIDGEQLKVRHSYLDSDLQEQSIASVFDHDPLTLAKTLEANPFLIEVTFPETRILHGFSIMIGAAKLQITLKCFPQAATEPIVYTFDAMGMRNQPELSFDLPTSTRVQVVQVEILDPQPHAQTKIHVWELRLR